jgi:hypothetical protein
MGYSGGTKFEDPNSPSVSKRGGRREEGGGRREEGEGKRPFLPFSPVAIKGTRTSLRRLCSTFFSSASRAR